jgi:hypothetical protein
MQSARQSQRGTTREEFGNEGRRVWAVDSRHKIELHLPILIQHEEMNLTDETQYFSVFLLSYFV